MPYYTLEKKKVLYMQDLTIQIKETEHVYSVLFLMSLMTTSCIKLLSHPNCRIHVTTSFTIS